MWDYSSKSRRCENLECESYIVEKVIRASCTLVYTDLESFQWDLYMAKTLMYGAWIEWLDWWQRCRFLETSRGRNDNVDELHSSADSQTSLPQRLQTCPSSSSVSWLHMTALWATGGQCLKISRTISGRSLRMGAMEARTNSSCAPLSHLKRHHATHSLGLPRALSYADLDPGELRESAEPVLQ